MKLPPRAPDDPRVSRVLLRGELIGDGLTDRAIARLVAEGVLHKLRHGAYVDGAAWRACDEVGQHGLRARAVLRQAKAGVVLSHSSAAGEWDVPFWDLVLDDVQITREDRKAGRHEAGVQQHVGLLRPEDVVEHNGVRVTAPIRTALDCAAVYDVEHGVTIVGDLLHRKLTTRKELFEGATFMEQWPGSLKHRPVLMIADGRCESVGEHRVLYLCWKQKLPMPVPQYAIRDEHGRVVAEVDFAWPELGVFLEFDGKIKYQELLKEGESVTDVVLREKKREEMICRLTGWRCIRIVWADLYHPERTAADIRALLRPKRAAG